MKERKKAGIPASRKQIKEAARGRKCLFMMAMVMMMVVLAETTVTTHP